MKRILSIILCLCMLLSSTGLPVIAAGAETKTVPEIKDTGTAETPDNVTVIMTDEEFRGIPSNYTGHFALGADITLSAETISVWSRCGFEGVLDGRGHTLTARMDGVMNGGCGLFNYVNGTIKNLNLNASIELFTGGNLYGAGLLVSCTGENAYIYNCNVSGSIAVQESDPSACLMIGGLVGSGHGVIERCTVKANITVTTPSGCDIGGIVGSLYSGQVRDSSYDGRISLVQTGDRYNYYSIVGIANCYGANNSSRCTVSGSISAALNNGNGRIVGAWMADDSENHASVTLNIANGDLNEVAGAGCGTNTHNYGTVTVYNSGSASAMASGLVNCNYGTNNGAVIAISESGKAEACGICRGEHCENNASISATTDSGYAGASGAYDPGSGTVNRADISAKANSGGAIAFGLNNDGGYAERCFNYGDVTAANNNGSARTVGIEGCSYSENHGKITSTCYGSDRENSSAVGARGYQVENHGTVTCTGTNSTGNTYATGVADSSSVYSINYGAITSINQDGHALATGVEGRYSRNYGDVRSESSGPRPTVEHPENLGNAYAYGAGEDASYSYNGANVSATAQKAMAYAYGVCQTSNSVSIGHVSATAAYFSIVSTTDGTLYYLPYAEARGSTSVSAHSGSAMASATSSAGSRNFAYLAPTRYCLNHSMADAGFYVLPLDADTSCYVTSGGVRGCYYMIGGVYATDNATYSQEIPEYTPEPETPEGQSRLEMDIDVYDADDTACSAPLKTLYYAGGSFSWDKANAEQLSDPAKTDFRELNLRVTLTNQGDAGTTDNAIIVYLKAPKGFSFRPDAVVRETNILVDAVAAGDPHVENVPLYPIYSATLPVNTEIEYWLSSARMAVVEGSVTPFCVERLETEGLVRYRNSFDTSAGAPSREERLDSIDLSGMMESSEQYHDGLAMISVLLSGSAYKYQDILDSLLNLGFSNIKRCNYYMENGKPVDHISQAATKVACTLASKKLIEDGKVKNMVVLVVRGTVGEEWFDNFDGSADVNGAFAGFADAESYLLSELGIYMNQMGLRETDYDFVDNKILITGHSRGAAAADLVAEELVTVAANTYATYDNIYTYTFAAPGSKQYTQAYTNIFNIINFEDVVARVPAGFDRPGLDLVVGNRLSDKCDVNEFNAEFRLLTGMNFNARNVESLKQLKAISGWTPKFLEINIANFFEIVDAALLFKDVPKFTKAIVKYLNEAVKDELIAIAIDEFESQFEDFVNAVIINSISKNLTYEDDQFYYKTRQLLTVGDFLAAGMLLSEEVGFDFLENSADWSNHAIETYVAWIKVMEGEGSRGYKIFSVNCPVDVEVFDSSGVMVAQVIDNTVTYTGRAYSWVDGESKVFLLSADEFYTFRIVGTDDGTMSISAALYDEKGGARQIVNFYDVPVTRGEASTGFFGNEYTIAVGDTTVYPDEYLGAESVGGAVVSLSVDGSGSAYGGGSYTRGDVAEVTAEAEEGITFTGWYMGDTLMSRENPYRFVVKDSLELTARFETCVTYTAASISLNGDIGVNYYAGLSDFVLDDGGAYMLFTVAGQTQKIMVRDLSPEANGTYKFTCLVAAKQMTDTIVGQIYLSDGTPVGMAREYSVKAYCDAAIPVYSQYPAYADLVELMEAMLNYGACSQIQFDYRTDHLANVDLTDTGLPEITAEDVAAFAHGAEGEEAGISVASVSLLLETTTTVRFYFNLDGSRSIDEYTFLVDGVEAVPVQSGQGQYYVDRANVAAKDLDEMITVTVGGLTVRYCGLSYVRQVVVLYAAYYSEALSNVARALYAYNRAANAYFG